MTHTEEREALCLEGYRDALRDAMENGRILAMHALQGHDYRQSESMRIAADFFLDAWRKELKND